MMESEVDRCPEVVLYYLCFRACSALSLLVALFSVIDWESARIKWSWESSQKLCASPIKKKKKEGKKVLSNRMVTINKVPGLLSNLIFITFLWSWYMISSICGRGNRGLRTMNNLPGVTLLVRGTFWISLAVWPKCSICSVSSRMLVSEGKRRATTTWTQGNPEGKVMSVE